MQEGLFKFKFQAKPRQQTKLSSREQLLRRLLQIRQIVSTDFLNYFKKSLHCCWSHKDWAVNIPDQAAKHREMTSKSYIFWRNTAPPQLKMVLPPFRTARHITNQ